MNVPYIELGSQHIALKDEILSKIDEIISSGQFIFGEETLNSSSAYFQISFSSRSSSL